MAVASDVDASNNEEESNITEANDGNNVAKNRRRRRKKKNKKKQRDADAKDKAVANNINNNNDKSARKGQGAAAVTNDTPVKEKWEKSSGRNVKATKVKNDEEEELNVTNKEKVKKEKTPVNDEDDASNDDNEMKREDDSVDERKPAAKERGKPATNPTPATKPDGKAKIAVARKRAAAREGKDEANVKNRDDKKVDEADSSLRKRKKEVAAANASRVKRVRTSAFAFAPNKNVKHHLLGVDTKAVRFLRRDDVDMDESDEDDDDDETNVHSVHGTSATSTEIDSDELARMPLQSTKQEESKVDSPKTVFLKWYKKQPTQEIMELFDTDLKTLQSESILLTRYAKLLFGNEAMANAFVKLVQSQPSDTRVIAREVSLMTGTIKAFDCPYLKADGVVEDFIEYVDKCHKKYKDGFDSYYSPYISLCQSSGYGKSRLLKQVAEKRKLLYICVGDSDTNFPGPNHTARNFLFLKGADEAKREAHLVQKLKLCMSWCKQNTNFNTIDQFGKTPATYWNDIVNHTPESETDLKKGETIWIAFDEARTLLEEKDNRVSDLRLLRRALASASWESGHRIFAIFVDTKSSIPNFFPSKSKGYSHRPVASRLFHPYILLSTHDTFKVARQVDDFTDDCSFVNCGRPLWKSLFPNPSISTTAMLDFVAKKLSGSESANDVTDDLALLAIVICRTGVYLRPQSSTASDLAANYSLRPLTAARSRVPSFLTKIPSVAPT